MAITEKNIGIRMQRDHLDDLPQYALPAGVAARWYEPGDRRAWLDIHYQSETHTDITEATFEEQFGTDDAALAERMCFLVDAKGEPVATASAWWIDDFEGGPAARLHWVAVIPSWQGRGVSKPLMSIVCERMRELGDTRAMLSTSTARPRAVNLYLHFGFRPYVRHETDERNWRELAPYLKYPLA